MNVTVLSALISAAISIMVALIGVVVAVLSSWLQVRSQLETLRQAQLTEVVKKRIETYPRLWNIVITYTTNWNIEGKPHDAGWASSFLAAINACHAEIGAYFSEPVYTKFRGLREALVVLEQKAKAGGEITPQEAGQISAIVSGQDGSPGLSTYLKKDLGSYGAAAIQKL